MNSNSTCRHIKSGLGILMSHGKHPPLDSGFLFSVLILLPRLPNYKLLIPWTIPNHMSMLPITKTSSSLFVARLTLMFLTTNKTRHIWNLHCFPFILTLSWKEHFWCLVILGTITHTPLPLLLLVLLKLLIILLCSKGSIYNLWIDTKLQNRYFIFQIGIQSILKL